MRQADLAVVTTSRVSRDSDLMDEDAGLYLSTLDHQHARLAESFRQFAELVRHCEQRIQAAAVLRELITEVGMHFGFEESLMANSGYREYNHHLRQHVSMMTEMGLLLDRLEHDDGSKILRQVDLLIDWYERHVEITDYKLMVWLTR